MAVAISPRDSESEITSKTKSLLNYFVTLNEAQQYDKRAVRIGELCGLLGKFRPDLGKKAHGANMKVAGPFPRKAGDPHIWHIFSSN